MSPMSLLHMSASSLRDAEALNASAQHRGAPTGERSERRLALWGIGTLAAVMVITAGIAFV